MYLIYHMHLLGISKRYLSFLLHFLFKIDLLTKYIQKLARSLYITVSSSKNSNIQLSHYIQHPTPLENLLFCYLEFVTL